jgi:multiple sugar transport system substrate-binding protein
VTMNTPQMTEALAFYMGLQSCSAPGPNYWKQAREFYITGQSPMLFYSTYVMDDLAGLQQGVEPTVKDLAQNTGFAPTMIGKRGDKATYGTLVTNVVFKGADNEATTKFLKFMLDGQNYIDILFLAPNGKIPVRKTALDAWSQNDIFKAYPKDVLDTIANGYNTMQRWAFAPWTTPVQRAVIGDMEGRLLVPQAISNVVQGQMTPQQATDWLQARVEELKKDREASQ